MVPCTSCGKEKPEAEICQDGYCRDCHVSLSFEECCDGSWVREQRRAAGLPVKD
jgi:hypothetical protein